jgi:hypothetical protein
MANCPRQIDFFKVLSRDALSWDRDTGASVSRVFSTMCFRTSSGDSSRGADVVSSIMESSGSGRDNSSALVMRDPVCNQLTHSLRTFCSSNCRILL